MSPLARGFASWAERTSLEVRAEMGVGADDPLDPLALSQHLDVPVARLSDACIDDWPRSVLLASEEFSALTVFDGSRSTIVVNDGCSPQRIRSSICHEIGHLVCMHPPSELFTVGCRTFRSGAEAEADRLAGALLIPGAAARRAARNGWSDEQVAQHFGSSLDMARWRMNISGARRLVA